MADETRATFAPVHRPQPPQIVKSCLHPSRNFNSLRRIVSSFSFFRRETLDHYHLSSPAKFSFLKVDDTRPSSTLFLEKTKSVFVVYSRRNFLRRRNSQPIQRSSEILPAHWKVSRVQSHELANGYYYSCSTYSPPIRTHRGKDSLSRQGYVSALHFP